MIALPLQCIRLETDALLRERAFFSRTVRGILQPLGYIDLVGQLAALAFGAGREHCCDLLTAASRDLRELREQTREPLDPGPCGAVQLYQGLCEDERLGLDPALSGDVNLAVVGTSWCADAAETLSRRYPHATRLLEAIAERGGQSLLNVQHHLAVQVCDAQTVYALAELTRGALLGVATYLDTTWRAPSVLIPMARPEPRARS